MGETYRGEERWDIIGKIKVQSVAVQDKSCEKA